MSGSTQAILNGTDNHWGCVTLVDPGVVSGTAAQFKRAVETLDTPAVIALVREDVQLFSPVPRAPFEGREVVAAVFDFLASVTSDPSSLRLDGGRRERSDSLLCWYPRRKGLRMDPPCGDRRGGQDLANHRHGATAVRRTCIADGRSRAHLGARDQNQQMTCSHPAVEASPKE